MNAQSSSRHSSSTQRIFSLVIKCKVCADDEDQTKILDRIKTYICTSSPNKKIRKTSLWNINYNRMTFEM